MNTNSTDRRSLIISIFVAVGWFGLLLMGVFLCSFVIRVFGIQNDLWAMLESISTAIAASVVVGAIYFTHRQLNESTNTRHMEVADRLFSELNSEENIEARRWVYQNLPEDPQTGMASLSPEGQRYIKRVLNSLDRVAFLTQPDWVPEPMVMPWMSIMVVKTWTKLKPYVEYERLRRHEPDYYRYAQRIAERCISWRKKNVPDAKITWLADSL